MVVIRALSSVGYAHAFQADLCTTESCTVSGVLGDSLATCHSATTSIMISVVIAKWVWYTLEEIMPNCQEGSLDMLSW